MGRNATPQQAQTHIQESIDTIKNYLTDLIAYGQHDKADKLCFWIEDWVKFLAFENRFSPARLKRYKRGEVIRAHLGFNIGSEYGGLHYCIVLDKANSKNSPVITIVPLTSAKKGTDVKRLYPGNVFLGSEVYQKILSKANATYGTLLKQADTLNSKFRKIDKNSLEWPESYPTPETHDEWFSATKKEFDDFFGNKETLEQIINRIQAMKVGSIALVSQVRTISKIRIYEPKTGRDPLSNIRLSNESLDLIDSEFKKLYLK